MNGIQESAAAASSDRLMILPGQQGAVGATVMLTGTVKAFLTEREATVETANGQRLHARQAASCLLAPAINDRVLICEGDGEAHILAVLERNPQHVAELAVPGARQTKITSAETLHISVPRLRITASEINLVSRTLNQVGEVLVNSFRRILENVVDKSVGARTITTRAEARTAVVRDVDTVKAGTLVQTIDKVATQQSEISLMTAKEDVRLDGKRVTVG